MCFSGYVKRQILAPMIQVGYVRIASLVCFSNRHELETTYISFSYSSRARLTMERSRVNDKTLIGT